MQIDLRTVSIKPLRQTYDHVAARIGQVKSASRYQEATIGLQAESNFHYRPLWAPEYELFDASRTALKMHDWYAFNDPRQFYYGTYTITRARMQETTEADFEFAEERGAAAEIPASVRELALEILLPLRHVAWGSNMNNSFCAAYGYGTAITQPCLYQAMDQLGIAQYLTRIGLLLEDPAALDAAKTAWMKAPMWQSLRHLVEDLFVTQDWFELFTAQNFVVDGLLYPLVYHYFDALLIEKSGLMLSMLTRFQVEWFEESSKWVDASVRTAASQSPENRALLARWTASWRDRAVEALAPIATHALGDRAGWVMQEIVEQFDARAGRLGLAI